MNVEKWGFVVFLQGGPRAMNWDFFRKVYLYGIWDKASYPTILADCFLCDVLNISV